MTRYIGVSALIAGMAVIATGVYRFCGKDRKEDNRGIDVFIFYAIILYAVVSFVKMVLGEPVISFFDSFLDMQPVTYIHYSLPLFVLALILPVFHRRLLKEVFGSRFVVMFNSLFFLWVLPMHLIVGKISNRYCVFAAVASGLGGFAVSMFYKGTIEYFSMKNLKERVRFFSPIIMLWTVTVMIYEPNQLILNNFGEFQIPYPAFLGITVSAALLTAFIYMLIGMFMLTVRQFRLFGAILFGVSIAGYIQGNFMNGEMAVMDGNVQEWAVQTKLVNIAVWIVLILVSVFVYMYKNQKVRKLCKVISVYLCLTQVVSLAYVIVSTDLSSKKEALMTTNHALEISSKNNVIVFVLDSFEQQLMDAILEQNPDFDSDLADFTCYHNTSSRYAFTHQSIPYLLTHVEWKKGMSDEQYIPYAYENGRLLYDISQQGYSVGVYTEMQYVAKPAVDLMINYTDDVRIKLGYAKTIDMMTRTSRYKMAPFAAKEKYCYETGEIGDIVVNDGIWSANNDIVFYGMVYNEGLSFMKDDDYDGAFRFYHLKGAHASFNMDENGREAGSDRNRISQSKGSMKIVYEYLREMKKLRVYDDATIIITADHGQNDTNIGERSSDPVIYDLTASPILYVKLPNEHGDSGGVRYSNAPVSHTEFAATVISAVGGDSDAYGRIFSQIREEEERERSYDFLGKNNRSTINQEWKISGDVNDIASWELLEEGF